MSANLITPRNSPNAYLYSAHNYVGFVVTGLNAISKPERPRLSFFFTPKNFPLKMQKSFGEVSQSSVIASNCRASLQCQIEQSDNNHQAPTMGRAVCQVPRDTELVSAL